MAAVACLGAAAVLGPLAFFRLEGNAPARLHLPAATGVSAGPVVAGPVSGTWVVSSGSQAGYRVQEILFGQHHTAVGRTSEVSGGLVISGTTVDAADFTVDMGSVTSDQAGRNVQFKDYILDTGKYPHAYFHLSQPIHLGAVPQPGQVISVTAVGSFELRGVTRTVTFTMEAERLAGAIDVNAEIPVTYSLWHIPNPSFAVAQVGKTGTIEVLLHFVPATTK
jgi:polyisoprenoid-binding protein YceI